MMIGLSSKSEKCQIYYQATFNLHSRHISLYILFRYLEESKTSTLLLEK